MYSKGRGLDFCSRHNYIFHFLKPSFLYICCHNGVVATHPASRGCHNGVVATHPASNRGGGGGGGAWVRFPFVATCFSFKFILYIDTVHRCIDTLVNSYIDM